MKQVYSPIILLTILAFLLAACGANVSQPDANAASAYIENKGSDTIVNLALAWAGFWAGDSLGWYMNWTFWSVGVLNAGMGTVGSVVLLLLADIFSHIRLPAPAEKDHE